MLDDVEACEGEALDVEPSGERSGADYGNT